MNEIKKYDKNVGGTGIALAHPGVYRAIDVRRDIVMVPQAMAALNTVEKRILQASIKTPISEMDTEELASKVAKLAEYISRDAGIKKIDAYDVTRFLNILTTYYSTLSLSEVKMAFELSMIGELDDYLPRDRDGRPDKNHYQSFSVDYVAKILNAYNNKSKDAQFKAYNALPTEKSISKEDAEFYIRECNKVVVNYYLTYKYTGRIPSNANYYMAYEAIDRAGLAESINITDHDKKQAFSESMNKVHSGLVGAFVGDCIRRQGDTHDYVIMQARRIAMERALKRSFDAMIREEVQLTDYLTIK